MPSSRAQQQRRRSNRELETRRKDRQGYLILVVCVVLLIGAMGAFAVTRGTVKVDKVTGCPLDAYKVPAHTIVLVDETDRLSPMELRFAQDLINTEYLWLPQGGRLTVRNILGDPAQGRDITLCRVDDGAHSFGILDNPRKLKRDYQRTAGLKLRSLIADLASAPPQKFSPIFEAAADTASRSDFGRSVSQRRLVLLSDLVQHSAIDDQYRGVKGRAADVPGVRALDPDFQGVAVRLQYVKRPELARIQGEQHKRYWTEWFEHQHAVDVQVGHDILLGEKPDRPVFLAQPSSDKDADKRL